MSSPLARLASQPDGRQYPHPEAGKVVAADADSVYVTFDRDPDPKPRRGPYRWHACTIDTADAHDHAPTVPPAGARCLVFMVETTIQGRLRRDGWVLAHWSS